MRTILLSLCFVLACCTQLQAKPKYFFKIASLAPEGSVWINHFREFADEVKSRSGGEIGFRIYPGGVMGDDMAMYRKMRVGQLHGGGFTMSGIANVVSDFRIMAIPFLFKDYAEVDQISALMRPYFEKQFSKNGLELLSLTEVGFIYGMSTIPTATIGELKDRKSWVPTGDPLASTFMTQLGVTPIPLTIPDVLSSLQTGLVDTVYTSLYGSLVMQWFTKASYITDFPYGYAYGAIALSQKAFKKLPKEYAELMHEAADKHFTALNSATRKSNRESRDVLQTNGVKFIRATEEVQQTLKENRDVTIQKLVGNSFSKEALSQVTETLQTIRNP